MAKIVVLAQGDDADKAKAAMDTAGLDFQIVEPSAANLLHLVIGIVGTGDDESLDDDFKDNDEKPDVDDSEEESNAEVETQESLGECLVDEERVQAYAINEKSSRLVLAKLEVTAQGDRTTYSINESQFTFWPSDSKNLSQRISVENKNHRASVEVSLISGVSTKLLVGTDLLNLFK